MEPLHLFKEGMFVGLLHVAGFRNIEAKTSKAGAGDKHKKSLLGSNPLRKVRESLGHQVPARIHLQVFHACWPTAHSNRSRPQGISPPDTRNLAGLSLGI